MPPEPMEMLMNNDTMILPATDAATLKGPGPVAGAGNRHRTAVDDGPAFTEVLAAADEADGTDAAIGAGAGLSAGVQADRGGAPRPAAEGRRERPVAEEPHPDVPGATMPDSSPEIPQAAAGHTVSLKERFGKAAGAPALVISARSKGGNPGQGTAQGPANGENNGRSDRTEGIGAQRGTAMVSGSGTAAGRVAHHQRRGVGDDRAVADRAAGPQRSGSDGTIGTAGPLGGRSHGSGVAAGPGAVDPALETTGSAGGVGGRSHGSGVVADPGAADPAVEATRVAGGGGGRSHGSGVATDPGAAGQMAQASAAASAAGKESPAVSTTGGPAATDAGRRMAAIVEPVSSGSSSRLAAASARRDRTETPSAGRLRRSADPDAEDGAGPAEKKALAAARTAGAVTEPHDRPVSDDGAVAVHERQGSRKPDAVVSARMHSDAAAPAAGPSTPAETTASARPEAMAGRLGTGLPDSVPDSVVRQVADRIGVQLRQGASEVRIALKPETLGHLDLKISADQHQVTVRIMAETPAAKELIEAHLGQLRSDLSQQGLGLARVEVDLFAANDDRGGHGEDRRFAWRGSGSAPGATGPAAQSAPISAVGAALETASHSLVGVYA